MKKISLAILIIILITSISCSGTNNELKIGESDTRTGASIKQKPVKIIEQNAKKTWPQAITGKYKHETKKYREQFELFKSKKFKLVKTKLKNGKPAESEQLKVNGNWVILEKSKQSVLLLKHDNKRRYFRIIKQGGYRSLQSYDNEKNVYYPVGK